MANNTNWLNISQLSGGTGQTELSLTALTNSSLSSKTATVKAYNSTYNVSGTTTVTIQGFVPTLTLSRSTLRFDATGGTGTFTVYSNTAWTITFPSLVQSYSVSAGTGDTEVTIVLPPNLDMVAKMDNATVKDVYNVNSLYLTIVQEAFINELTVTPDDDIIFTNTGSSTSITIDSNCDWELDLPDWVTASVESGSSGTTTVTLTAGENGPTDRSGEIKVYYGSKEIVIGVYQPFYIEPYITVTPSSHTYPYEVSSRVFTVDSYPEWTCDVVSMWEDLPFDNGVYVKAKFTVPSATTLYLYNSSGDTTEVYVNAVRQYTSRFTAPSSGTYEVTYIVASGGTAPQLGDTVSRPYITEVVVSEGIGALPGNFLCGASISSITIPSTVTSIGDRAFRNCGSLSSITTNATTAPSICANTFYGVATGGTLAYPTGSDYSSWLSTYRFYLGYYGWNNIETQYYVVATYYVSSTTSQTKVVNCLKNIDGDDLFSYFIYNDQTYNPSTGFTFPTTGYNTIKMSVSTDNFIGERNTAVATYPPKGVFATVYALREIEMSTSIAVMGSAITNAQGCFEGCTGLTYAKIPGSITEIGGNVFWGCKNLETVELGNGVSNIPTRGFYGCSGLTSLTLPNSVTRIYDNALQDCQALASLIVPSGVTDLGVGCFYGCSSLTGITIPNAITSLPNECFRNCASLRSSGITLPSTLTSLGERCFAGCTHITGLTISESITNIGGYCFQNCSALKGSGISLPGGINLISQYCFSGCTSLTSITLPSNVTAIGQYAFAASGLKELTLPASVTSIGSRAFASCASLSEITSLPTTSPTLGNYPFIYIKNNGVLYYPTGSDYSSWFSTSGGNLSYYGWTGVEI